MVSRKPTGFVSRKNTMMGYEKEEWELEIMDMSNLDLAFIYSGPLFMVKTDNLGLEVIVPFEKPLITDIEYENLVDSLKSCKKDFRIKKVVATYLHL